MNYELLMNEDERDVRCCLVVQVKMTMKNVFDPKSTICVLYSNNNRYLKFGKKLFPEAQRHESIQVT